MKYVLLALIGFSQITFAHQTKVARHFTNQTMQQFSEVTDSPDFQGQGFASAAYLVTEITPPQGRGESEANLAVRIIKSLLHRDYPITGDDGGYGFNLLKGPNAEAKLKKFKFGATWLFNSDKQEASEALLTAIRKCMNSQDLYVFVGSGGGNNTSAEIVAIYDSAHQEIVYLIASNFGSDD